jgi:predicted GIY-YIG superfamily endonuclease
VAELTGPLWMSKAKAIASSFRPTTAGAQAARHSVYVVLLYDSSLSGRWGLYVGQTSRDPDWRFDQHKSGYKASAAVRRFGVRLLPQLFEHLNPLKGWESLEIEAALADAFRGGGIEWVEGGH